MELPCRQKLRGPRKHAVYDGKYFCFCSVLLYLLHRFVNPDIFTGGWHRRQGQTGFRKYPERKRAWRDRALSHDACLFNRAFLLLIMS